MKLTAPAKPEPSTTPAPETSSKSWDELLDTPPNETATAVATEDSHPATIPMFGETPPASGEKLAESMPDGQAIGHEQAAKEAPAETSAEETSGNGEELNDKAEAEATPSIPEPAPASEADPVDISTDALPQASEDAVVDEAAAHYKAYVTRLQQELTDAILERIMLQNHAKLAKQNETRIATELSDLYAKGPDRRPLFDTKPVAAAVPVQADGPGEDKQEAPQPMPPDAKEAKRVRLLKKIEANGRVYGEADQVVTAYVDVDLNEDGDDVLFLAELDGEEDGEPKWATAFMEADEYEVIDLEAQAALATGSTDAPAVSGPTADDESWRATTIEQLGIPTGICKILREDNEIETLGQIADHGKTKALTDLEKIGESKAEKIQAAMDKFWAGRI